MADERMNTCSHPGMPEPKFDREKAKTMTSDEVRRIYPRLHYACPACKSNVIGYASFEHYLMGDW